MRVIWIIALAVVVCANANAQNTRARGLQFLDQSAYQSIPLAIAPLKGELPQRVDMSANFPTPGDQGNQGSCVGWAVSYLKTYQERTERKWSLATANHRFSPAFIYNQIKVAGCQEGALFVDALNLLRQRGAATADIFPYTPTSCSQQPSAAVYQAARQFIVADWRRVNVQDPIEVKSQLAAGFPVLIGAMVGPVFSALKGDTAYKGEPSYLGGHAMVVVGYDDSRQAYRVINSYGVQWADNGFFWLDYSGFKRVVRESYVAQDVIVDTTVVVEDEKPQPKPKDDPKPPKPKEPEPQPQPEPQPKVNVAESRSLQSIIAILGSTTPSVSSQFPAIAWSNENGLAFGRARSRFGDLDADFVFSADSGSRVYAISVDARTYSLTFNGAEQAQPRMYADTVCRRMNSEVQSILATGSLVKTKPAIAYHDVTAARVRAERTRLDDICEKNGVQRCGYGSLNGVIERNTLTQISLTNSAGVSVQGEHWDGVLPFSSFTNSGSSSGWGVERMCDFRLVISR